MAEEVNFVSVTLRIWPTKNFMHEKSFKREWNHFLHLALDFITKKVRNEFPFQLFRILYKDESI